MSFNLTVTLKHPHPEDLTVTLISPSGGKALLRLMAVIAREQNCFGMRWEVLDWNTPAIDFYGALGARVQNQWTPVMFRGSAFEQFASEEPAS